MIVPAGREDRQSADDSFNPGADNWIHALAVLPDGQSRTMARRVEHPVGCFAPSARWPWPRAIATRRTPRNGATADNWVWEKTYRLSMRVRICASEALTSLSSPSMRRSFSCSARTKRV